MYRRSDGAAAVDFVLLTVPLLVTALLAMRVIWVGYEKATLTVISSRAASVAALADTSSAEAKDYAESEVAKWLGNESEVDVTIGDFATVSIRSDGLEVTAHAISELY